MFQWRYCIRLENLGEQSVQLRERHWRIFSLSGTLETVRGRGVVGQEPVLSKKSPAFQYSSHVSLQAPSGHMWLVVNKTFKPYNENFVLKIINTYSITCCIQTKYLIDSVLLGEHFEWREKMDIYLIVEYLHFHWRANPMIRLHLILYKNKL